MLFWLPQMFYNDFIVTPNQLQGIWQVSKVPSLLLLPLCACVFVSALSHLRMASHSY